MINQVYQLISPRVFSVKYEDVCLNDEVLIRPRYLAICHADQRYYLGKRDASVLRKKLPMALIHESCGEVLFDPTSTLAVGQKVVLIPNIPGEKSDFIYENYARGSGFRSSGYDGFMREFVNLPVDRVVPFNSIPLKMAAITEFVSVAVHAVDRFECISHMDRDVIGIWGDGSLAFVVACVLERTFPDSKIVVVGKDARKLSNFSFVHRTYLAQDLPQDFYVDHAFECAGGEGSYYAIDDVIRTISPQGTLMLMGVSENKIPIKTRDVLEKGLTLVGCSRSGRKDFERSVEIMEQSDVQNRLHAIIYEIDPIKSVSDLHRAFSLDLATPFKTVFEWNM